MLMSRRIRAFVSLILLPVMLSTSVVTVLPDIAMAQSASGTTENACLDGQTSAKDSVSGMWFFAGCLGFWGCLFAYIYAPSPSAASLLGKSPEYVAVYTDCFKEKAKSLQLKNAVMGCLVMSAVYVVIYAVAIAAAVEETNNDTTYGHY
jgi:hypothetical protein